jgi:hypothetical protein
MASQNTFTPAVNVGWDPSSGTLSPFFQKMTFSLDINVSETYSPAGLYNRVSAPDAQLQSVSYVAVFPPMDWESEEPVDEDREASEDELMSLAYARPSITFSSSQLRKTYQAPSGGGQYFTVRDLLDIVCKFEAEDRLLGEWFGGIDVHHVFYEGTQQNSDGSWQLCWGS